MSFTSSIKNEISKLETTEVENIAELSAIFRNIADISNNKIKVMTENASVARRIFNLIKDIYFITPKITVRRGNNFKKTNIYILEIKEKNQDILEKLSLIKDNVLILVPADYLTDDQELTRAYLRGLFMAVGSINDPKKSRYHLEFIVNDDNYAKYICQLLSKFYINSKFIKKDKKFMIYIKEAEKIGDFLRIISAIEALLYFEDIRIYRDHKNMTNRLNNCEQANVDKIIKTAVDQVKDIEIIETIASLDMLEEKLKIAATYRKKYPDASLLELSEIVSYETEAKISKSGLYHRLNKIRDIAEQLRKNQKM